ncbi:GNAT family N-acetyltransferase, partial [Listeria monocytogenes]|uniref:GNAT family N-acetyltransferase n=1 Tax=Listeria monocytogenes TaxID=1639 RepID=UPI0021D4500D
MGEVFVDSLDQPKSSLAKLGRKSSFGFLAGQPTLFLLEVCSGEDIILVPQHKGWSVVTQLPNGFELRAIDEKVYNSCLEKEWSQDLVANYATYQYYKKQGIGYVVYY